MLHGLHINAPRICILLFYVVVIVGLDQRKGIAKTPLAVQLS